MRAFHTAGIAGAVVFLFAGAAFAQQSDGDVELTVFGAYIAPDLGGDTALLAGQVGWYATKHIQFGGALGISFTEGVMGGGDTTLGTASAFFEWDITRTTAVPFLALNAGVLAGSLGDDDVTGVFGSAGVGLKVWLRDNTALRLSFDHQESSQTIETAFGDIDQDTSQDQFTIGISVLFGS